MNRINVICLGVRNMEKSIRFYRGYHAYFADLDGYYWEVAYNPFCALDENGILVL